MSSVLLTRLSCLKAKKGFDKTSAGERFNYFLTFLYTLRPAAINDNSRTLLQLVLRSEEFKNFQFSTNVIFNPLKPLGAHRAKLLTRLYRTETFCSETTRMKKKIARGKDILMPQFHAKIQRMRVSSLEATVAFSNAFVRRNFHWKFLKWACGAHSRMI